MEDARTSMISEILEPLDDWVHIQPSSDDERKGRIYLPVDLGNSRLYRCIVLGVGGEVRDLHTGELVLVLATNTIEMRDGSRLVRRQHIVARLQD